MKASLAQALAETNAAQQATFAEGAQHSRSKPLPPDGIYNVSLLEVDGFPTAAKDEEGNETGVMNLNINVTFKILDGEREGGVFEQTYWGNSPFDAGRLRDLVAAASGKPCPETFVDTVTVLEACEGNSMQVSIVRKASKNKPGKINEYLNFKSAA